MKKFIIKTNFYNVYIMAISLFVGITFISLSSIINDIHGIDGWFPAFFGAGLISFMGALVNADYDKDETINGIHWKRGSIRIVLAAFLSISIFRMDYIQCILPFTVYLLCVFWIVFDPVLNLKKGNPLSYKGDQSLSDRIIGKRGIFIKVVVLIGSIVWFYRVV